MKKRKNLSNFNRIFRFFYQLLPFWESRRPFLAMTPYRFSFLRLFLGIAFLLMRKSIVLAAMKVLVIYQMPL